MTPYDTNASLPLSAYPRPSLAVDPAVLTVREGKLATVLWRRSSGPFEGKWALPGVFVNELESLEDAARRGLSSKLGLRPSGLPLEQLFTWNRPNRDPRGWVVTVAYYALHPANEALLGICESESVKLCDVVDDEPASNNPTVPSSDLRLTLRDALGRTVHPVFDHLEVINLIIGRLRTLIWQTDAALRLLPSTFTLREMQMVYEAVLSRSLNKDSFRRRVVRTQRLVSATGQLEVGVEHRPAELYSRTPGWRPEGA